MPDQPTLRQDDEAHWRSCKEFVRLLIAQLNGALKGKVLTSRKRKQICSDFTFSFCQFLDQQWFKPGGQTEYPLLCFTNTFFDLDVPLDLSQINFPHKSIELHAMVADEIRWFFDEMNEDDSAVLIGDLGEETTDQPIPESVTVIPQPCPVCKGAGQCYCLRKGSGSPVNCARCKGTGQCTHCGGSGEWKHP